MTIGERIRDLRERHGYGQAELARLVGMTPNTLWRIEHEGREPRGPALRKIAEILQVDVATLRGLDDKAAGDGKANANG
jgi:transcriptional regulator with XRE-family HTH domain